MNERPPNHGFGVSGGPRAGRFAPGAPQGLPELRRGKHHSPSDGSCLMEYVSVLAGQRFSDHPRCTHPVLSMLARSVNDLIVNDHVRARLVHAAPALAASGRDTPRASHDAICAVTEPGLRLAPDDLVLSRAAASAQRLDRHGRTLWGRLVEHARARIVLRRALLRLVGVLDDHEIPAPKREDLLVAVLSQATRHHLEQEPRSRTPAPSADDAPSCP